MVDFDVPVDRRYSDGYKWARYKGRDVNPHWVADMDFKAPQAVIDALHDRVAHGVYGYADPSHEHAEVVQAYLKQHYDWSVAAESIIWLPGLVCGLHAANQACAAAGGNVFTITPIYPPFLSAPNNTGQQLITVPALESAGSWDLDFDAVEDAFKQGVDHYMLCNPHNPLGRVYRRQELEQLVDLCLRYGVTISSDEIHCDLILDQDTQHIPTACISPDIASRCMTFMAPSKTYNLPGLACCFAVIEDKGLRRAFLRAKRGIVPDPNILGMQAALVAYRDCADWKQELLQYLAANRDELESRINAMPGLSMKHVEGTYLAWIDVRELGLDSPAAAFEEGGVILSDGVLFKGAGFVRFNFGCTRALMNESLDRMQRVCERALHG